MCSHSRRLKPVLKRIVERREANLDRFAGSETHSLSYHRVIFVAKVYRSLRDLSAFSSGINQVGRRLLEDLPISPLISLALDLDWLIP